MEKGDTENPQTVIRDIYNEREKDEPKDGVLSRSIFKLNLNTTFVFAIWV